MTDRDVNKVIKAARDVVHGKVPCGWKDSVCKCLSCRLIRALKKLDDKKSRR